MRRDAKRRPEVYFVNLLDKKTGLITLMVKNTYLYRALCEFAKPGLGVCVVARVVFHKAQDAYDV